MRDGLELLDRPSECQSRAGVGDGSIECSLCHTDRIRADAGSKQIERSHGDGETMVHVAEHVTVRDENPIELEASDRVVRNQR